MEVIKVKSYQITFYVPESHLELVKKSLFESGAGKQGEYEHTCWQALGVGQFRPIGSANPTIGQKNQLCSVEEYKVEMICDEKYIKKAIESLKSSHPYEEPAFSIFELEKF